MCIINLAIIKGVFIMKPIPVSEIEKTLNEMDIEKIPEKLLAFKEDSRKSVSNLIKKFEKKYSSHIAELERLSKMSIFESEYRKKGFSLIAGTDEAGRGPLAGPVCAAAVILPEDCIIKGLNDSKKLSAKKRDELFDEIKEKAISYSIIMEPPSVIDEINILQATYSAMRKAVNSLSPAPDFLLADAVTIPNLETPQMGIIKGDAKSVSIAAASILAMVTRDRFMVEIAKLYPEYKFESNKGYGSAEHILALKTFGPTPIHRKTFIKNFFEEI